jgi:hypothetical protein
MLLGHGAIGQFGVAEALSGLVVNAGTVELTLGQSVATSTGSETVTGSASFALTRSVNFFLWNEVDDSASATWKDVEPGSTD